MKRKEWQVVILARDKSGRIIGRKVADGKNVDNWGKFLSAILTGAPSSGVVTITLKDTAVVPADKSVGIYGSAWGTGTRTFNCTTAGAIKCYVQLGTNTTPAQRGDTRLLTPITGTSDITFSYTLGGESITGSTTITYGTPQSPTELGLFFQLRELDTVVTPFLIDRTVFSALPPATSFTIVYTIPLG